MTKQQHLSWSPVPTIISTTTTTATTTTTTTTNDYHSTSRRPHHRHHHHQYRKNQFYTPLYRSMTDEDSYADKPSPITRFVTKLLGKHLCVFFRCVCVCVCVCV